MGYVSLIEEFILLKGVSAVGVQQNIYVLKPIFFYEVIFVPIILKLVIIFRFWPKMSEVLSEEERQRDTYRAYIYAYLAISTAVLLALIITNAKGAIELNDAVFCAVVNFIGFELALSMQTYKFRRFSAELIDGIIDNARFALYLTIMSVINSVAGLNVFTITIMLLLILVYMADYMIKIYYNVTVLRDL